ncbi:hypothetical protein Runsl_3973 [Runella slithyformis DSM 19594]|uniref:Uncharacterized protein n=1 Tax=Runella slithyformis (strain ATCC 29530 / DSM 19594 / LMG 11500 / NCIMB 11436 / LSU 4) TaxID=761193 RepID=A0A7U3ZN89_RUNSL|nr:hypothetical protein Runsl_3973 [Runella slithyformis DSM 19594]
MKLCLTSTRFRTKICVFTLGTVGLYKSVFDPSDLSFGLLNLTICYGLADWDHGDYSVFSNKKTHELLVLR